MSTQQPPGGAPDAAHGYSQPQDPWAGGFDGGLASVPTDPIPQPYDPYASGTHGDVWSQPTVAHGGPPQPPYAPMPPKRGNAVAIGLVVVVVLALGGGGGYAAYHYLTRAGTTNPTPSATETVTYPDVFPYTVKVNDCVINNGTRDAPTLGASPCSAPGSYTVIKVVRGAEIPEGPNGKFDRDTTAAAECAGTRFQSWYGYKDPVDPRLDVFFCMTDNPGPRPS